MSDLESDSLSDKGFFDIWRVNWTVLFKSHGRELANQFFFDINTSRGEEKLRLTLFNMIQLINGHTQWTVATYKKVILPEPLETFVTKHGWQLTKDLLMLAYSARQRIKDT